MKRSGPPLGLDGKPKHPRLRFISALSAEQQEEELRKKEERATREREEAEARETRIREAQAAHSSAGHDGGKGSDEKRHPSRIDRYNDSRLKRPCPRGEPGPIKERTFAPYKSVSYGLAARKLLYPQITDAVLFGLKENGVSLFGMFKIDRTNKTCSYVPNTGRHNSNSDQIRCRPFMNGTYKQCCEAILSKSFIPYAAVQHCPGDTIYICGEICIVDEYGCDAAWNTHFSSVFRRLKMGYSDGLIWMVYSARHSDMTPLPPRDQRTFLKWLEVIVAGEGKLGVVRNVLCTPEHKNIDALHALIDYANQKMREGLVMLSTHWTRTPIDGVMVSDGGSVCTKIKHHHEEGPCNTRQGSVVKQDAGFIFNVDRNGVIVAFVLYIRANESVLVPVMHIPFKVKGEYTQELKDTKYKPAIYEIGNHTGSADAWVDRIQYKITAMFREGPLPILKIAGPAIQESQDWYAVDATTHIALPPCATGGYICLPVDILGSEMFSDSVAFSATQVVQTDQQMVIDGSFFGPVRSLPPTACERKEDLAAMGRSRRTLKEHWDLVTGCDHVRLTNGQVFRACPPSISYDDAVLEADGVRKMPRQDISCDRPAALNRWANRQRALCRAQDGLPPKARTSDTGNLLSVEIQTLRGVRWPVHPKMAHTTYKEDLGRVVDWSGPPFLRFLPDTDFTGTGCSGPAGEDPSEETVQSVICPMYAAWLFELLVLRKTEVDCVQNEDGSWSQDPELHYPSRDGKNVQHWYDGFDKPFEWPVT